MTDDYVRLKVREALNATDGDRHDAQKLLITWAVRDPALLLGLAKPHLKAIAASLIEHSARAKTSTDVDDDGPDHLSRTAIDDIVADSTTKGLDKRRKSNLPPPKSTERQASTMRKLAAAFTKKRK